MRPARKGTAMDPDCIGTEEDARLVLEELEERRRLTSTSDVY